MSILIKVLTSEKEKSFKLQSAYHFAYKLGCVQALNRLKSACPQPAHPVSRLKKSFLLISLCLPTLKALRLKAFERIWNLKVSSERNEVSKFSCSIVVSKCGSLRKEDDFWQAVKDAMFEWKSGYCL